MKLDRARRHLSLDSRDPAFYQDPYPAYRRLHEEAPVVFWEEVGRWCFAGHREVSAILRDRRFGRSMAHVDGAAAPDPFLAVDRCSMLDMEPPTHTRIRRMVQGAFVSRQIERLGPRIAGLAHRLVDRMEESEAVNLFPAFASPLPVIVIAEMLGVPTERTDELLEWSHAMVAVYEVAPSEAQRHAALRAEKEFVAFLRDYVAQRRRDPREDLLTLLIQAEEDGDCLSEDELVSTCILLLNAGHEATVNVIGNGLLALLREGEQLERWRDDPSLTPSAVEELLRFDTPLHLFNRWVLEDLEIGGLKLEQGMEVSLILGAANRDPAVFTEPDRLDLSRSPNPHVSFGAGVHFCLGAPLARLELQTALPILLERLPNLALDEEPSFRNSYHFRGLESLRLRC